MAACAHLLLRAQPIERSAIRSGQLAFDRGRRAPKVGVSIAQDSRLPVLLFGAISGFRFAGQARPTVGITLTPAAAPARIELPLVVTASRNLTQPPCSERPETEQRRDDHKEEEDERRPRAPRDPDRKPQTEDRHHDGSTPPHSPTLRLSATQTDAVTGMAFLHGRSRPVAPRGSPAAVSFGCWTSSSGGALGGVRA